MLLGSFSYAIAMVYAKKFITPLRMSALLIGLGLFGTGFAFVMYYFIIDRLGTVMASSVYYIPPIIAFLIGAWVQNEPVSWLQVFGTLAVISGIYFARDGEKRHAIKNEG